MSDSADCTRTPSTVSTTDIQKAHEAEDSGRATPVKGFHESVKEVGKDFGIFPVPSHLQYDPQQPNEFGLALNFGFAFASTFTVANLYYCQPLLIQLAESFNVSHSEVSKIPTLIQAGYATGLLLFSPLGDLIRRRQLILALITCSTLLTIALSLTYEVRLFQALSFLVGTVSIPCQVLIPLAADLAPETRRSSAVAIVCSGLFFGILTARVLAGLIGEFAPSWRVVYYFAIGVQTFVLTGTYCVLPDYPSKNKQMSYFTILGTMAKFAVTEPVLVQASMVMMGSSACFSNLWVTLTFLLGGAPYHFSTLLIGLFGLIGMAGVATNPFAGKLLDKLLPWYGSLISIVMMILFHSVHLGAGGIHIAAVAVAVFGLDVVHQSLQVSLSISVFTIEPAARARLNAVLILSIFIGQVIGTSAGTHIFLNHGWRASTGFSMGVYVLILTLLLLRGPRCSRYTWFGYEGGLEPKKDFSPPVTSFDADDKLEKGAAEKEVLPDSLEGSRKTSLETITPGAHR